MITSISNNIGIAQVSFKDYQTENFAVLQGRFDVDPTTAAWKAANEIVFEFPSLMMNKSNLSAVYFIDTRPFVDYETTYRGTILKSWISNNRLHIVISFRRVPAVICAEDPEDVCPRAIFSSCRHSSVRCRIISQLFFLFLQVGACNDQALSCKYAETYA